ncbi:hypothetical protein [Mesorhizobium opportunistum]|jgi:hypothetical protein|uniref:hypothetical protein n=1 Tax=Mesorhizobium opportunistum TaxID=593909 RepID=UPI0003CE48D0|nr:hypothetical protein X742_34370 [Mesorhizobium sp. LNHC232B00]
MSRSTDLAILAWINRGLDAMARSASALRLAHDQPQSLCALVKGGGRMMDAIAAAQGGDIQMIDSASAVHRFTETANHSISWL